MRRGVEREIQQRAFDLVRLGRTGHVEPGARRSGIDQARRDRRDQDSGPQIVVATLTGEHAHLRDLADLGGNVDPGRPGLPGARPERTASRQPQTARSTSSSDQVFEPRMQRRRQRAQAAGTARHHEQPPAIAQQGREAAQDMRGAEIVGRDIVIDHGRGSDRRAAPACNDSENTMSTPPWRSASVSAKRSTRLRTSATSSTSARTSAFGRSTGDAADFGDAVRSRAPSGTRCRPRSVPLRPPFAARRRRPKVSRRRDTATSTDCSGLVSGHGACAPISNHLPAGFHRRADDGLGFWTACEDAGPPEH